LREGTAAGPEDALDLWYSMRVELPFVQIPDQSPSPDRHLYFVLLLHRPEQISTPKVWVNGKEAPVRYFSYARVKSGCYYVDGSEAGLQSNTNTIVVFFRHNK
jgi:hypothetical protein